MRNTGKPFEDQILDIANIYEARGFLSLVKTDPPVRVVGTGNFRKVIFMENPFVDFVGCWQERAGRSIYLEAKSTGEPELQINASGGLTETQFNNLCRWERAGAATGVLWELRGKVRFIRFTTLYTRAITESRKIIHWHHAEEIKQGVGFIFFDFINNLRAAYPDA